MGAPGAEGRSLATLPSPDGLFIKCRLPGRRGPLEGTPRSPGPRARDKGVGSARGPGSLAGIPGKSPPASPPSSAPQTQKRAQEARGARVCQSNVRRPTPGGGFVNNLPFLVAPAGGVAPPTHANRPLSKKPLKSGLGFLSSYFFFFSSARLTSSGRGGGGRPRPDSPSPLPSSPPRPPPPSPGVE